MVAGLILIGIGTPKTGMTSQDNVTMNGHSIVGWILQFSDG